jgi:hypothetical protein
LRLQHDTSSSSSSRTRVSSLSASTQESAHVQHALHT